MFLKRRRNSLATSITWLFVCLLCIGLFVSVRRKRRIKWSPPEWQCDLPNNNNLNKTHSLIVVMWTPYYNDPQWLHIFNAIQSPMIRNDRGASCVFTVNRLPVQNADAVIFHGHDLDFTDLPTHRCPSWQTWVYFSLDAPVNTGLDASRWEMANAVHFNLAMSYSRKADVIYPLGKVVESDEMPQINKKVEQFVHSFFNRGRNAIWLVGENCITPSARELLVAKLIDRGIEVDIIGKCPNATQQSAIAEEQLTNYRFYFAFEDSYCDDYLKEAFKALAMSYKYGVIPVIYSGASNLHEYLPPGSYIDASNLANVNQVASQLQQLSRFNDNANLVAGYYSWQRNFKVVEDFNHKHGLTALCDKLWSIQSNDKNAKSPLSFYSADSERDLRLALGNCYQPYSPKVIQHFFF